MTRRLRFFCFVHIMLWGALFSPANDGHLFPTLDRCSSALGPMSGQIQKNAYGPWNHDPNAPPPKHAYSPFDPRFQEAEPARLIEGVHYSKAKLVIKFIPGIWPEDEPWETGGSEEKMNVFNTLELSGIEPVFPASAGKWACQPGPDGRPYPDLTRWYEADWNQSIDVSEAVELLMAHPFVDHAEPLYLRQLASGGTNENKSLFEKTNLRSLSLPSASTDPLLENSWHLDAIGVQEGWQYLEDQGLPPGGNRDLVVAVIDTGVDYNHPDLASNIWINSSEIPNNNIDDDGNGFIDDIHGANVVSDSRFESGDPADDHGHGTHVAGIIAMQSNNGIGGSGIAYNARILAIKAAQYSGVLNTTDISQAIFYAVEKGADVINMSYGGYSKSQIEEDALTVAFGQAVLIAAAGNDAKPNEAACYGAPKYPAAYNWVLGIMASDESGNLAEFSNTDCVPRNRIEYEFSLPGLDILSTLPGDQYAAWDGTSMAAPIASGMACLLRTKWADKNLYSSRFIMGQLVANKGNLLNSLTTTPAPELRLLEHWLFDNKEDSELNDGDGIIDNGETVHLAIVLRNHWGKADNVIVKMEAIAEGSNQQDPYVTFEVDEVNYGAIGSFNWDDNGLIYDDANTIKGVRNPFQIRIDTNTPNNHVIEIKLSINYTNGYENSHTTNNHTIEERFNLIVMNGASLKGIIDEDITLTSEKFWIIEGPLHISPGVTMKVAAGSQIQFYNSGVEYAYIDIENGKPSTGEIQPFLESEGTILFEGNFENPIELFPDPFYPFLGVDIRNIGGGTAVFKYCKVVNPLIGLKGNLRVPHNPLIGFSEAPLKNIDHCFFISNYDWIGINHSYSSRWAEKTGGAILADTISNSIFRYLGRDDLANYKLKFGGIHERNLFDTCMVDVSRDTNFRSVLDRPVSMCTFINNYSDNGQHGVNYPKIIGPGYVDSQNEPVIVFFKNNILNHNWKDSGKRGMEFLYNSEYCCDISIANNYWGGANDALIEDFILDLEDGVFNIGKIIFKPELLLPDPISYPCAYALTVNESATHETPEVSLGLATFRIKFSRDMDPSIQPRVSFGPDAPFTDYIIHPVNGGWANPREWVGEFNITPLTGDGYQLVRIAGAVAADDPWLVTGDDAGRFRFEIVSSGTEALSIQSVGGEGFIDLSWMQDDFDLLAGFNLYRSQNSEENYQRINRNLIPPDTRKIRDRNVQPGEKYFYKFTVVKTDFKESNFSNVSEASAIDTVPPVLNHNGLKTGLPGLPVTLTANATDNVAVKTVILYYRIIGDSKYMGVPMTRTVDNRYAATIEGSKLIYPGIEYYIIASDGISQTYAGRAEFPLEIEVIDKPFISGINPRQGPATGGTEVTIIGSNFKEGAKVEFNAVQAENIVWVNSSQLTCITPGHLPLSADVKVTNPDGSHGVLPDGFSFSKGTADLSMPQISAGRQSAVRIPISISNADLIFAVDMMINYDATVLLCTGVHIGEMLSGWHLTANTSTAGTIRISSVSTKIPVSGHGQLFHLEFNVIGASGSSTSIDFGKVTLNDGAIEANPTNGSIKIDSSYDVRGRILFWKDNRPIPEVTMSLYGEENHVGESVQDGTYSILGAGNGSYELNANKSNGVSGITAFDASLILQHSVDLAPLTGSAKVAADANKSGEINSLDAYYVLQYSVGSIALPFNGAGTVWEFEPRSRTITIQQNHIEGIDFTGILIGDVSGSWPAQSSSQPQSLNHNQSLKRSVNKHESQESSNLTVLSDNDTSVCRVSWKKVDGHSEDESIYILYIDTSVTGLVSLDVQIHQLGLEAIELGTLTEQMMFAQNAMEDNTLRLGLASAVPIHGQGIFMIIQADDPDKSLGFPEIRAMTANDGFIPVVLDESANWLDHDDDDDGQALWAELLAQTDPNDNQSAFKLFPMEFTDGKLQISWSTVPGLKYQLELKSSLIGSNWESIGDPITASENIVSRSFPLNEANTANISFYRVRIVM